MLLVGLGYNIKMLAAYMVLPAFYLVYLLTLSLKLSKKLLHLTGATALLLTISLLWSIIVDLTPAEQRPHIGRSSTNSVIELALGYNGIQRVLPFRGPGGMGAPRNQGSNMIAPKGDGGGGPGPDESEANGRGPGRPEVPGVRQSGPENGVGGNRPRGGHEGNAGGGSNSIGLWGGQQGFFRIFNKDLGGQISWLLPMALFVVLVSLISARRKEMNVRKTVIRYGLLWGMWIVPMFVYFSINDYFHPYYTCMLAPGIAALTGIGLVKMVKAYSSNKGLQNYLLPVAFVINVIKTNDPPSPI